MSMPRPMHRLTPRHLQAGLSLIETMVGIAVGLFIVGGALKLFIDNLDNNRRLLIETRVNQDLRAAADLIARDLRRAGYWQNAASGVWQPAGAATAINPNLAIAGECGVTNDITYSFDDASGAPTSGGFRLVAGRIDTFVTSTWQALTDPSTMTVTQFCITPLNRVVNLLPRCVVATCPAGSTTCPPTLTVRQYSLVLRGQARSDANVVRQLEEVVRVRNDELSGACPPA